MPGTPLTYVVSHRGRSGVDTMAINIGPPGGPPTLTRNVSTGNTDWQQVFGRYVVPAGQTVTRFGFAAVQNASGNPSIGGFSTASCRRRPLQCHGHQAARAGLGPGALRSARRR